MFSKMPGSDFNEKPRFRPVFAQSSKRVDREIVVVLQLKNQDARPQAGDRANRFVDVREVLHPDTGNLAKVESAPGCLSFGGRLCRHRCALHQDNVYYQSQEFHP